MNRKNKKVKKNNGIMIIKHQLFLVILFLVGFTRNASAQVDSVFWFAAPWVSPNHADNVPVVLRLSTFGSATTVRVSQPAGGFDQTVTIPANSLYSMDLSAIINTLECKPAKTILGYGIKVEADTLITAVYEIVTAVNNPETYSLKGQNGMGTEFVCPFQTSWNNGAYPPNLPKSMFCIIATENNTTVWITPKAPIVGHPANVTFSIVLQRGECYTAENITQNESVPGSNLSGSIVVSDKPISVTVSDDSVYSSSGGCRDLMGDQIVPTDVIGTNYVVNKGSLNLASQEGIYIVAVENFTAVTVTDAGGTTNQLLNQGDTYWYIMNQPLASVNATKPVYVLQASGFGCELGEALLPPLNCAGSNQVSFTRTNAQTFIINVLSPTAAIGNFVLNGSTTLVPASAFVAVPGTGGMWSGAQINFNTTDIPSGNTNLLTNSTDFFGLGIINGGSSSGCLFHYMSSFNRKVIVDAGNDTTVCTNTGSIPLNGSVKGGTTSGLWTVLNGSGTINSPTNLINSYLPSLSDYTQGYVDIALQSTGSCTPKFDTVHLTFIKSPIVNAGADLSYCKNNVPVISITSVFSFCAAVNWTGGNGGAIGNSGNPSTTYTPSPADFAADSALIIVTTQGSLFSCPDDLDSLIIHFTDAPTVNPGPNVAFCTNESIVNLNGLVSGSTTSGIWTSNGGGNFTLPNTQLNNQYEVSTSDFSSGQIRFYLTSTNNQNCLAVSDSIDVNFIVAPVITIVAPDTVCAASTNFLYTTSVTGGFPFSWISDGNGTINNPTANSSSYSLSLLDISNTSIEFIVNTSGLCPTVSDTFSVFLVAPPIVNAGTDVTLCSNETIGLNGTVTGGDNLGTWSSLGTGVFSPSVNLLNTFYSSSTTDITNGSVEIVLQSGNSFGCPPEKDTLLVTFAATPNADFTFVSACENAPLSMTDISTISSGFITSWKWYFETDSSFTQNPTHAFQTNGTNFATLIVTGSNGCIDTITKPIIVHPIPVGDFNYPYACLNEEVFFTNASFISNGIITNYLYSFAGLGTSILANPVFNFNGLGNFPVSLTVTSDQSCTSTFIDTVSIIPGPNADFTFDINPALILQEITFTDASTGNGLQQWIWNFGDGEGSNIQNTTHGYEIGGTFYVELEVTDVNGCIDTTSKSLSVILLPVLPSAFSPNDDGENDVFIIRGGPFETVDFKVYNNWGELIFKTDNGLVGWDGTYKGEKCPLDVYTWTFTVSIGNGQVISKSGDVTLIR